MNEFYRPQYIDWIIKEDGVLFEDGKSLECYRVSYDITNEEFLDNWATHLRKHYITDLDLSDAISELGYDEKEYLKKFVIPQKEQPRGPQTIACEIAEILLYDIFEHILNYVSLRGRHWNKPTSTSPIQGSDVLAVKIVKEGEASNKDELCVIEVKATLTNDDYNILKTAKEHSDKDSLRYSASLNFLRQQYRKQGYVSMANIVARFQQKGNLPYVQKFVAAGVISRKTIEGNRINGVNGSDIGIRFPNQIFLIHGESLMNLAYEVYGRITK